MSLTLYLPALLATAGLFVLARAVGRVFVAYAGLCLAWLAYARSMDGETVLVVWLIGSLIFWQVLGYFYLGFLAGRVVSRLSDR
jgi:hypothetical protein